MISDLGRNIRRIRLENCLSGNKLAEIAGVGSSTISQIENGKRQTLNGDTIEKIANALGVGVNDLLGNDTPSRFETNDILDIVNIMAYADFLTLDGKQLTHHEQILLETSIRMTLDAIRFDRLKVKIK